MGCVLLEISTILIGAAVTLVSFGNIVKLFYDKFFSSKSLNPKKWESTTATVCCNYNESVPDGVIPDDVISMYKLGKPSYKKNRCNECTDITYSVDGVCYQKTVKRKYNDHVKIYYKKKNPHSFRTADEVKENNYAKRNIHIIGFITIVFSLAVIMTIGIVMMYYGVVGDDDEIFVQASQRISAEW